VGTTKKISHFRYHIILFLKENVVFFLLSLYLTIDRKYKLCYTLIGGKRMEEFNLTTLKNTSLAVNVEVPSRKFLAEIITQENLDNI